MGKGDIKTKKGKRFAGSYGVSRKQKDKNTINEVKPKDKAKPKTKAKPKATTAKKTTTKKTTTKKTTAKKTADK